MSAILLCSAVAGLASVWTLSGLSEHSSLRFAPRVSVATAIGLALPALLYASAPAFVRSEVSLPLLVSVASVLALAVGAAKVEGALCDNDMPRLVRRAAGIVAGAFLGMAAICAASLAPSEGTLSNARLGWVMMSGPLLAVLVVFGSRVRYAGMGVLSLGWRALALAPVALALPVAAQLSAGLAPYPPTGLRETRSAAQMKEPIAPAGAANSSSPAPREAPPVVAAAEASNPPPTAGSSAAPNTPSVAEPSGLRIESIGTRGVLEADVRGGIERRFGRLQACLADPKARQSGALTLKVGIDASGSVIYSRTLGGDLVGSPLASCLLPVFYKMGFAAPRSGAASFEITLRAQPR